jgi:hypothetical protein
MKKSIDQRYLDVRIEIKNHFREMENETKIEMIALKALVALIFCVIVILIII